MARPRERSIIDENDGSIAKIVKEFEESWRNPGREVDLTGLPGVDEFKDAVEDICENLGLRRFVVFFDEAAHIFRPQQQRQTRSCQKENGKVFD
jgi:hypothetical protein